MQEINKGIWIEHIKPIDCCFYKTLKYMEVHQDRTITDWTAGGRSLQISQMHVNDSECVDSLSLPSVSKIVASSDDIPNQITLNPGDLIRWLAVSNSGMWLGTGKSSGHIAVLDTKTGLTISTWRAHESEVHSRIGGL
ncbi:hypothetical protein FQR65_LT02099 [Abscondita terminalis]|nr:hypothetical protein FQR65_LT02099 [Abscondita terminalis]